MREATSGVGAVLASAGIRIHRIGSLRKEEKTGAEEYSDGRSGNDPNGQQVQEDTDRKSTWDAAMRQCSRYKGRQQPLAPNIRNVT